jgi:adenylate cyclase
MLGPLRAGIQQLLRTGSRPTDSRDVRLRKEALVLLAAFITVMGTLWTATYLLLGLALSAAVPFTYQVVSVVSLAWFARTGNFDVLRASQIGCMLVLPFVLQWTLGGFENSSAVMIWAFAAPVGALVFYGPRQAAWVFAAFLALTLVSAAIDQLLVPLAPPLPDRLRLLFFLLNIGALSTVTYVVMQYFVAARERAQAESERLLHNVLPPPIADRLRAGESPIADDYAVVTVLFADVAGFTALTRNATADEVINILNRVFSEFDQLAEDHGLEKIKTIGDAYMAVAGAPAARADHAEAAAAMALDMLAAVERVGAEVGRPLALRIGIHAGPAMAGVIGRRKFAYDLWGDAVNVASRMESHGVPGRIQVSEAVVRLLEPRYRFEERGLIEIKGLGEMRTFFLIGRA